MKKTIENLKKGWATIHIKRNTVDTDLPYYTALKQIILDKNLAMYRFRWNYRKEFVFTSSEEIIEPFLLKKVDDLKYEVYIAPFADQFANDWFVSEIIDDDE